MIISVISFVSSLLSTVHSVTTKIRFARIAVASVIANTTVRSNVTSQLTSSVAFVVALAIWLVTAR